jgi:sulfatase maturation enzyme AslB (radical SAM superfamily)
MIYDLIGQKVIDYAEIIVILFEKCNLRCKMCAQDHVSTDNLSRESILSKTEYVSKWINNNNSKYFKLHVMGGEVFQDSLIAENYFDIYSEFMDELRSKVTNKEKHIEFNFVTNLVFENHEPVMEFLVKHDLKVSTSYDPTGRFTPKTLELFKRNIEIFQDRISMISCVMTAPSIKAVRKDEYFKYLYSKFVVDWDHYWPISDRNINAILIPSESETLEFYKFLIDNYPDCLNVEHFTTDKDVMKMTCTRGNNTTILQDNSVPTGCSGTAYIKERKTSDDDVQEVVLKFFKTYDCFSCEYFRKCPFTCFVKQDYKHAKQDLGKCVFKETFKYVEQKN